MTQEHKVTESSLMAYISLENSVTISTGKPVLGARCTLVLKEYSKHPHWTDFMIAKKALKFDDPNKVRPRRKELEDDGYVAFDGKRVCEVTGEVANAYVVTTKGHDLLEILYAKERGIQVLEKKSHD